jgi:trehalose 6-phosphate synthase/phosphatase
MTISDLTKGAFISTVDQKSVKQTVGRQKAGSARTGHRLVIISNRAPVEVVGEGSNQTTRRTVGGVANTFVRLLENHGGLWIAWSGGQAAQRLTMPSHNARLTMLLLGLADREVTHYYHGLCNRALWPLMHTMPQRCHFDGLDWTYYQRVNSSFAHLAAAETVTQDQIWVQDYHLALVPQMLRELRAGSTIGLFWHVPFPPESVFRIFPWREELLRGMVGADLIGFHMHSYAQEFLIACERLLHLKVDHQAGVATVNGRRVTVRAFPLGVAAQDFATLAADERVRQRALEIQQSVGTPRIILGVDRLDYTKGIPERLLAYEQFLERNPEYRERVTMIQIAVPSRESVPAYEKLRNRVEGLVGRIVGSFTTDRWVPLRYMHTRLDQEHLIAYYRAAEVALLTPLRDGMNLVAKEYVASRVDDDGVLVLSELAGSAEELSEALLVNPYDIEAIAHRLKQALEMPAAQRAEAMRAMRAKVSQSTLDRWSDAFVAELGESAGRGERALADTAGR